MLGNVDSESYWKTNKEKCLSSYFGNISFKVQSNISHLQERSFIIFMPGLLCLIYEKYFNDPKKNFCKSSLIKTIQPTALNFQRNGKKYFLLQSIEISKCNSCNKTTLNHKLVIQLSSICKMLEF